MPRRKQAEDNQPVIDSEEEDDGGEELEAFEAETDAIEDDEIEDDDQPVAAARPARPARSSAPEPAPRRTLGRSLTITLDADKFEALAKEARELGLDTGSLARVFILNGLRSQHGLGRDAAPVRPEGRPAPRDRDGERFGGPRRPEGFAPRSGGRDADDRPPRDRGDRGDRGEWNRRAGGGGGGGGGWNRPDDRGPARGGGWRAGGDQGGGQRGAPWGGYKDQGARRPPRQDWEDRSPGGFRPRPRRDER